MKLGLLVATFAVVGLMTGCDSNREQAAEKRAELQNTQTEAAKDIRDAQMNAVKDVNEAKEEAADDIQSAGKDLREAQGVETSTSGSTTDADDVKVTAEECAKYAKNPNVKPELKARYEACSKLNK